MNHKLLCSIGLLLVAGTVPCPADQPAPFTYQGLLTTEGAPATGAYDLALQLFDAAQDGNPVTGIVTNLAAAVRNGRFSVGVDFGAGAFGGGDRWIEIGVRTNGATGRFATLAPRQAVTATPYAIHAMSSSTARVADRAFTADSALMAGAVQDSAVGETQLVPWLRYDIARLGNASQTFHGENIFAGHTVVSVGDGSVPLTVVGNNPFPHLSVKADYAAPYGAFLSLDASEVTGGKNYLMYSTAGQAGEGQGRLVFRNYSDDVEVLSILPTGEVGLGTHNPGAPLHVTHRNAVTGESLILGVDSRDGGYTVLTLGLTATSGGKATIQAISTSGASYGDLLLNARGGNVGVGTTNPATRLDVAGEVTATAVNITSDRNAKQAFHPVEARQVLGKVASLPIMEWEYKSQPGVRHIGPMAQDFYAAFDVGRDERHITSVDADGVALASIQGLHQMLQEQDAELAVIRELNRSLLRRLAALEEKSAGTEAASR